MRGIYKPWIAGSGHLATVLGVLITMATTGWANPADSSWLFLRTTRFDQPQLKQWRAANPALANLTVTAHPNGENPRNPWSKNGRRLSVVRYSVSTRLRVSYTAEAGYKRSRRAHFRHRSSPLTQSV